MIPTLRMLAAVTALTVAACGNGTDDTGTQTGSRRPAPVDDVTSTTIAGDEQAARADDPQTSVSTGPGATTSTTSAGALPGEGQPAAEAGEAVAAASVYVPPAGTYVYDVTGHVETTGLTGSREAVPPTSTDEITVADGPAAMRMTVITRDEGRESSQEVVIAVTDTEARLVRLSYRPGSTAAGYSVNPDPPALIARMPYQVDDSWEIAWSDPSSGISGVGTGSVTGAETITTPSGSFDTVIVTVTQRLRGTIEGTLTATSWIDRSTGVQAKQHLVTEFRDATGASRTDATRVLRERPM